MKKRYILMIAVTCLGLSFYTSFLALTQATEHYAETMAKDMAIGYTIDMQNLEMEKQFDLPFFPSPSQAYEMLKTGPPFDGWIGVFDSQGNLIEGSKGSTETPEITQAIKSIFTLGGKRILSLKGGKIAVIVGWDGKQVGLDGEYAAVAAVTRCLFPKAMPLERFFMCLSICNCFTLGLFICFLRSLSKPHAIETGSGLAPKLHDNVLQTLLAAIREMNIAETYGFEDVSDELSQHFLKAKYILSLSVKEVRKICDEISPEWMTLSPEVAFEEISREISSVHKIKVAARVCLHGQVPEKLQYFYFWKILKAYADYAVTYKNAKVVGTRLEYKDNAYVLTLKDNGTCDTVGGLSEVENLVKQFGGHISLSDSEIQIVLVLRPKPEDKKRKDG